MRLGKVYRDHATRVTVSTVTEKKDGAILEEEIA